jgi:Fe-S cluster assembly protein SufB
MSTEVNTVEQLATQDYKYGFKSDIETETIPKGLNEDTIRLISEKKTSRTGCSNGALKRTGIL